MTIHTLLSLAGVAFGLTLFATLGTRAMLLFIGQFITQYAILVVIYFLLGLVMAFYRRRKRRR